MAKLLEWQKDRVLKLMDEDTFNDRRARLTCLERALALAVILERYGRDALARFDAVPAGWLPVFKELNVGYGNHRRLVRLEEARALPAELYHRGTVELSDRLGRRLVNLDDAEGQLHRDREALLSQVKKALAQFKTEAALRDGWPEAWAHLERPSERTVALPAVRVADVNELIRRYKEAA